MGALSVGWGYKCVRQVLYVAHFMKVMCSFSWYDAESTSVKILDLHIEHAAIFPSAFWHLKSNFPFVLWLYFSETQLNLLYHLLFYNFLSIDLELPYFYVQHSKCKELKLSQSLLIACFLFYYSPPLSVLQVCFPRWGGLCDRQGQLKHELPLLRYVHPGHSGTNIFQLHALQKSPLALWSTCSNYSWPQEDPTVITANANLTTHRHNAKANTLYQFTIFWEYFWKFLLLFIASFAIHDITYSFI